jgi:hypothetical protein
MSGDLGIKDHYSVLKDAPVNIQCVPQQILFPGFGG